MLRHTFLAVSAAVLFSTAAYAGPQTLTETQMDSVTAGLMTSFVVNGNTIMTIVGIGDCPGPCAEEEITIDIGQGGNAGVLPVPVHDNNATPHQDNAAAGFGVWSAVFNNQSDVIADINAVP